MYVRLLGSTGYILYLYKQASSSFLPKEGQLIIKAKGFLLYTLNV